MASMAEKRKKRMADAGKRDSMSRFASHLKPLDIPQWQPKAGNTYTVDVLAYGVTKAQGRFKNGNVAAPGQLYMERTYWTHRGIGPNEDMVCCPAQFGKPCPVCEERKRLEQNPKYGRESPEVKALWTSQRMVMLVYVHEEKEKGLQWFDVSNHAFGKQLDKKRKFAPPEIRDRVNHFFDTSKDGFSLRIVVTEADRGGGGKYPFFDVYDFVPRKKDLPEKLVEQADAIDLATLPIEPEYAELKRLFLGQDEGDEKASRNGKPKAEADDDDDDEDEGNDTNDEDEDDDTDEDEDDAEVAIEVGSVVTGVYKGRPRTGVVKKKKGTLLTVAVKGIDKPWVVEEDEVSRVTDDLEGEDEGEDDDDGEENEDDDDGEEGEDDDDGEDEGPEDEDEEGPLEDDDDDDEDKPVVKKSRTGKKPKPGRRL